MRKPSSSNQKQRNGSTDLADGGVGPKPGEEKRLRAASDTAGREFPRGWRRTRVSARRSDRSIERAEKVIRFIECLRIPEGSHAGRKFILRPWQKDFIHDVYGTEAPNGNRQTRRAILSVARKNGKTALLAALILVHLCGPEAKFNSEIVSAANSKEQAGVLYRYAAGIVRLSPWLSDKLNPIDSTMRITYPAIGTFYRAIAGNPRTKHGQSPIVVIYDELAQARNSEMFDVLVSSQGAHEEPLFLTISTQSHNPMHILSTMIEDALSGADPRIMCHLYEVPDDVENIFDEEVWLSANPGLGDFRSLEDVRTEAETARRNPSTEGRFRNLFLNQRASTLSTLLTRQQWEKLGSDDVSFDLGEGVFLGLDMATTTDLAALSMVSEDGKKLKVFFWKPEDLMVEHSREDRFDYALMRKQGRMEPCPGKTINPTFIANKLIKICSEFRVHGMAYDRAWMGQLKVRLSELGFSMDTDPGAELLGVPFGQGWRDMSPAIAAFEEAAISERFVHDKNPLLTWNVANAVIGMDHAGNRVIDKAKTRMRIDGMVSAVMAFGLRAKLRPDDRGSIDDYFNSLG